MRAASIACGTRCASHGRSSADSRSSSAVRDRPRRSVRPRAMRTCGMATGLPTGSRRSGGAPRALRGGRPTFEEIDRTVTLHVVIRDDAAEARTLWAATARRHGLAGRIGADGTERGLSVGGSPAEVAEFLAGYRHIGVAEAIFVFRHPWISRPSSDLVRSATRSTSLRSALRSRCPVPQLGGEYLGHD